MHERPHDKKSSNNTLWIIPTVVIGGILLLIFALNGGFGPSGVSRLKPVNPRVLDKSEAAEQLNRNIRTYNAWLKQHHEPAFEVQDLKELIEKEKADYERMKE